MSSQQGIVVHVTSGESGDWQMALRNLRNLASEDSVSVPPEAMKVVVNGEAVRFLLSGAPESSAITEMARAGVEIDVCSNSLDRFGYDVDDLADGVSTVPSGVAEVARIQQDGHVYLKLP